MTSIKPATRMKLTVVFLFAIAAAVLGEGKLLGADGMWATPPARRGGEIVIKTAMVVDDDEKPTEAGKKAALALIKAMGKTTPKIVIVSECFEDKENKEKVLKGIASVLPEQIIVGSSSYGSYTQSGCSDFDTVALVGIGGKGISVAASLVTEMGVAELTSENDQELIEKRLRLAGAKLAGKLRKTVKDRLMIILPDAHSPKNQLLLDGVQMAAGKKFPITGGSANKNAGQTFVYFEGKAYSDSAVALMLSGDFKVFLSGRKAKDNDAVISTANEGAAAAVAAASEKAKPLAMLAFDCGGRRSKLKKLDDELQAIQKVIGKDMPLFGSYCAGEIGPVDSSEKDPKVLSGGAGWHVMFTLIVQ